MSKHEKLLKKIDTFYKHAVYGDRSSFLNAVAQDGPTRLSGSIREHIESLIKDVAALKPNSQSLQSKLMDFVNFNTENRAYSKQELNELYQAVQEASALITGPEHAPQAERASELAHMVQQLISSEPYGPSLVGGQSPLDYGSSPNSHPSDFASPAKPAGPPTFPKESQRKLNEILSDLAIHGKVFYVPFKASGILDAGTRKALEVYKAYMKLPKASMKELINSIDQSYIPLGLEQAAKTQEENSRRSATPPGMPTT